MKITTGRGYNIIGFKSNTPQSCCASSPNLREQLVFIDGQWLRCVCKALLFAFSSLLFPFSIILCKFVLYFSNYEDRDNCGDG